MNSYQDIDFSLEKYVELIEQEIKQKGVDISREKIVGYLLYRLNHLLISSSNGSEDLEKNQSHTSSLLQSANPLDTILGPPEDFAWKLIGSKDLDWPETTWHENEIGFSDRNIVWTISDKLSPYVIQATLITHLLLAIISILFFTGNLLNFLYSSAFYSSYSYYFFSFISPSTLYTYGVLALIVYPGTAKLSQKLIFRSQIDNWDLLKKRLDYTIYIQIAIYIAYIFYFLTGSSIYRTDAYWGGSYPINYVTLSNLTYFIFPATYLFYYGLKYYYLNRFSYLSPLKPYVGASNDAPVGIIFRTFFHLLLMIALANLGKYLDGVLKYRALGFIANYEFDSGNIISDFFSLGIFLVLLNAISLGILYFNKTDIGAFPWSSMILRNNWCMSIIYFIQVPIQFILYRYLISGISYFSFAPYPISTSPFTFIVPAVFGSILLFLFPPVIFYVLNKSALRREEYNGLLEYARTITIKISDPTLVENRSIT